MRLNDYVLENSVVLIVEDDKDIARILRQYAESQGCRVHLAHDGQIAVAQHQSIRPDIILLDLNLPKRDGFEILQSIRSHADTPVIIISARIEDEDKLKGLGLGADDYIVKPFNPSEVMARMKAVLHRTVERKPPDFLRHSDIEVDLQSGQVIYECHDDRLPINLTPSEYEILVLLMRTPNKVFSREEMLSACFPESDALERTVDSHVSHLRKKLMKAGASDLITVRRGIGYRFGKAGVQ